MAFGPAVVANMRDTNLRVFQELGDHPLLVSIFLRAQQHPEPHCVNPVVHLDLIPVLVVLFVRPDTHFPSQLFSGFPAVGWIPPCGLWDSRSSKIIHLSDGNDDAHQLMLDMKPSPDDGAAVEAGIKDFESGFCSKDLTWNELMLFGRTFWLIRRFVINQASGKNAGG
jgi:hypothetical protein